MLLVDYNCDGKKDLFVKVNSGVGVYENISAPGQLRFAWALGNKQFIDSDYGSGRRIEHQCAVGRYSGHR